MSTPAHNKRIESFMVRIHELIAEHRTISFEFFPPKSIEGAINLTQTLNDLRAVQPSFLSVTYGAAGSDRERTADAVIAMQSERNITTMPHLTCLGHRRHEVTDLCDRYADAGVENILALRGDLPADGSALPEGDFRYASELVEFLKDDGRFSVGVAAHPEGHPLSESVLADRQHLARKLEVADFGITQFFFEAETYLRMVDDLRAAGCDKPIIPGVMPITKPRQVERFATMAGASIPAWLVERIDGSNPDDVAAIGIDVAQRLSQQLIDAGAPGIHLYTLNKSGPSLAVAGQLFAASF